MKKTLVLFVAISILSCKKENKKENTIDEIITTVDTHSSENSLDWKGSYVGILPCNDCLGINTEIILNADNTYTKSMIYMGDNRKETSKAGNFIWLDDNTTIILDDDTKTQLKINENSIVVLDEKGNEITNKLANDYILYKNICENKDFEEYEYEDKNSKKYLITYGSGCDGAFAEVKINGINHHLLLKYSDENGSIFENKKGIRLTDKNNVTTLTFNEKEINLTPIL